MFLYNLMDYTEKNPPRFHLRGGGSSTPLPPPSITATGIFPLWLTEKFPPKINASRMLLFVGSKLEFQLRQNGQRLGTERSAVGADFR